MTGYLAGATIGIQGQLDAKAPATHALAGDAASDTGTVHLTGLRGRAVAATAPLDGQALVWSAAASAWQPGRGHRRGFDGAAERSGGVAHQ